MDKVEIGSVVVFVDQYGKPHDALVTAVHGHWSKEAQENHYRKWFEEQTGKQEYINEEWLENCLALPWAPPSINVVYVSMDHSQTDSYGIQIVRSSSVPAKEAQPAHGYYWRNK